MRYVSALIAVRDIKKAREFYEGLFGLTASEDYGENVTYSCGFSLQEGFSRILGLPEPAYTRGVEGFELYFEEDDLESLVAKLPQYGAELLHGIKEMPWAQRVVRFYDLDSHIIEAGESFAAIVRRLLATGMDEDEIARITQQTKEFVLECKELVDARR